MYEQVGVLYAVYESSKLNVPNVNAGTFQDIESFEDRPTPDWLNRREVSIGYDEGSSEE